MSNATSSKKSLKRVVTTDTVTEKPDVKNDNKHNIAHLDEDYIPVVYKIPDLKGNIYDHKIDPIFSSGICYPKFTLGFHHFIHQSKGNMEVVEQFEGKKKVYYVMSKFEKYIDDYDKDLAHVSRTYFDIDKKPDLICRAFFKLWEILYMFNIVPLDTDNFVSAHLAEGPGSFIQATMFYRDMYGKKGVSKNDKYYGITLHADDNDNDTSLPIEQKFIDYYHKEKPERVVIHKTYNSVGKDKDDGDLTKMHTVRRFSEHFTKRKADLVTGDGGFKWKNENLQEQEAFTLILGQIITALNIQEKNGSFVLKIYESFTEITIKLLCILKSFYDDLLIVKPLTSRKSNSEKYVVCMKYKGYNKDKIRMLEDLLDELNTVDENKHINDIFPSYKIPRELQMTMIACNTHISNRQFQSINEIISFVNKQNYRGDEYIKRRKMQIDATAFWTTNFYPELKDFSQAKKTANSMIVDAIDLNNKYVEKLSSRIE